MTSEASSAPACRVMACISVPFTHTGDTPWSMTSGARRCGLAASPAISLSDPRGDVSQRPVTFPIFLVECVRTSPVGASHPGSPPPARGRSDGEVRRIRHAAEIGPPGQPGPPRGC